MSGDKATRFVCFICLFMTLSTRFAATNICSKYVTANTCPRLYDESPLGNLMAVIGKRIYYIKRIYKKV